MLQCFRNVNQHEPRADSESTWPQFCIVHHSAAVVSSTGRSVVSFSYVCKIFWRWSSVIDVFLEMLHDAAVPSAVQVTATLIIIHQWSSFCSNVFQYHLDHSGSIWHHLVLHGAVIVYLVLSVLHVFEGSSMILHDTPDVLLLFHQWGIVFMIINVISSSKTTCCNVFEMWTSMNQERIQNQPGPSSV